MQLDDEQLGLNSHEPSPPPTASSRSASPTPSTSSQLDDPLSSDESFVSDVARGVASFGISTIDDEEENLPTPKRAGKRRQAKSSLIVPEEEEEEEEDPFAAIGIAKKSRRAKGKGKGGNSGTATPEVTKVVVPVEEDVEEREGAVEQEEEKMPAAKKSRRAKGKGKSTPASGAATPLEVVEGVTADGEAGERKKKVVFEAGESDGNGEMSKKDRRKAKEAARKGAGPDELVSLFFRAS